MYSDDSNTLYIGIIIGVIRLERKSLVLFIVIKQKKTYGCAFSLDSIKYINDFSVAPSTIIMSPEIDFFKIRII